MSARPPAEYLFSCIDEVLPPAVDELGLLGDGVGATVDPSNIELETPQGFRGTLRLGRSDRSQGHRRWGAF